MNKLKSLGAATLMAAMVGMVSCGGGGGGSDVASTGGGIGGTGITSGTVNGFGSVFVNGVEFETTNATITADDLTANEAALRVGMVVTVRGDVNADGVSGTAESIEYDDELQGPITAIAANADDTEKTLTVFGLSVMAKRDGTTYEGVGYDYDALALNDIVEVSGYYSSATTIQATHIEKVGNYAVGAAAELTGTITNLNAVALTFDIKDTAVTVSYAAADTSDLSGGAPANGMYVEVKGNLTAPNAITATELEAESDDFGDDVDEFSIEGIVTGYVSDSNFKVAGQPVNASGADFEPAGLTLVNGMEVEVEGSIVNGILVADEVELESGADGAGDVKIYANILSKDVAASTFTLDIPGSVAGSIVVEVDTGTEVEDEIGAADSISDAFNWMVADFVRVEGLEIAGNHVLAKQIKRDAADKYLLQGVVDASDMATQVEILGVTLVTPLAASYEDATDTPYAGGRADFYTDLDVGADTVKVVDDSRDGIIDAVEYEN